MKVKFTILGCGSSLGVPRIDGFFGNCNPNNKKNYRTRSSALISLNDVNILIDTSPDLKKQLLSNNIKNIDKVFYTHNHADQTHGINELRFFFLRYKKKYLFMLIQILKIIYLILLNIVLNLKKMDTILFLSLLNYKEY